MATLGIEAGDIPSVGMLAIFQHRMDGMYDESVLIGNHKVRILSIGSTIRTAVGGRATIIRVEDIDDGSVGGRLSLDAGIAQAEATGLPILAGYIINC